MFTYSFFLLCLLPKKIPYNAASLTSKSFYFPCLLTGSGRFSHPADDGGKFSSRGIQVCYQPRAQDLSLPLSAKPSEKVPGTSSISHFRDPKKKLTGFRSDIFYFYFFVTDKCTVTIWWKGTYHCQMMPWIRGRDWREHLCLQHKIVFGIT